MRAALWLIGLFIAAVTLALFAGDNQGTVTVFWPPQRVDLSVNLALLLLAALFALLYAALRALAALVELPRQARRWRAQQRERATQGLMLDARVQLTAGRYLRARKAAEQVLARLPDHAERGSGDTPPPILLALRTLAHLTAAEGAHALQDDATRNRHLEAGLDSTRGAPGELREALLLRAAHWALNERDPHAALARLAELPGGAQRRTAALRLKLKAARQSGHLSEAMETARLLAKHGAFSPAGAASLLRALAREQIARAGDPEQLLQAWGRLEARERALPELALCAAERGLELELPPERVRDWLAPAWEGMLAEPETWTEAQRARLVRVLELAMASTGAPSDQAWLGRIEAAQQAAPRDALLQYLTAMICMRRGLWGRAQLLLDHAVRTLEDAGLRRNAWCALARLAEQRGDSDEAARAWRAGAQS